VNKDKNVMTLRWWKQARTNLDRLQSAFYFNAEL
jgi:hypothetical protein